MKTATVKYQIGTYSGTVEVPCNEETEHDTIISRAKNRLRGMTSMTMYYESYEIIDRP